MGRVSKKRRKKKKSALPLVLVVFATIAAAAAGLIFFMAESNAPSTEHIDPAAYFGMPAEDEKTIVVSGEVLADKAMAEYETVYILYDDARQYLNPRIYYDESADLLTIALPEEILNIKPDETLFGKEECALKTERGLCISLDFLASCSDIEAGLVTDAPQVMIRTKFDEVSAPVPEDAPVRQNADVRSPIIRDVTAGETVTVLAEEEQWTRVQTADGFIGYMESLSLGAKQQPEAHQSLIGSYTDILYDFPINMVFHQTDSQASNAALAQALEGTHGINVIAPTWFFMNDVNGSYTDLSSADYVETAHSMGMKVWAVANDFDGTLASPADTKTLLEKTEVRQQLAKNLTASVKACGADGLNLDFENVREESAAAYLMLIRELAVYCAREGIVLSVDSYVPQLYNMYLDRAAQAEAADYIVTMAYDEHHAGSEEAGSVSSISWVQQAITGTMAEVPENKIIIALPFYTRMWESNAGSKPTSKAMGMREAAEAVQTGGMKTVWDEETQQDYAESNAGVKKQIWLENARSLKVKIDLIREYNVAGTAAWKLGLEMPEVWDLLEK